MTKQFKNNLGQAQTSINTTITSKPKNTQSWKTLLNPEVNYKYHKLKLCKSLKKVTSQPHSFFSLKNSPLIQPSEKSVKQLLLPNHKGGKCYFQEQYFVGKWRKKAQKPWPQPQKKKALVRCKNDWPTFYSPLLKACQLLHSKTNS